MTNYEEGIDDHHTQPSVLPHRQALARPIPNKWPRTVWESFNATPTQLTQKLTDIIIKEWDEALITVCVDCVNILLSRTVT